MSLIRECLHTILGTGVSCKYIPCCSAYARESIRSQSLVKAFFLISSRLLRCHPFTVGGYDPVPMSGDNFCRDSRQNLISERGNHGL